MSSETEHISQLNRASNGGQPINDSKNLSTPIHSLRKSSSYEKAMSMPHGTVASSENNEKWITETRKQLFPDKVDWTVQAINGTHIWLDTESSGCMIIQDCKKSGPRKRCAACKLVAHQKCIESQTLDRTSLPKCRSTYREASQKADIECSPQHHVVQRRKQEGRCEACGKNFQSMLSYKSQKDFIAENCSWCKRAFHIKHECSKTYFLTTFCDMGIHKNVIIPPSWIVKLPSRKYSQMNMKRGRASTRRHSSKERRAFVIKPIETENKVPLIVFVNPKSGGNQGGRILEKYQYILNPRQVFDLSQGGPRFGLELFRKVPNLRVLVCGGDGTVGWILSEIDKLKLFPAPAVSVLPLGTGNDLSRFLGWGAGYTDEPPSKILSHVEEGELLKLDRWDIDVRPNADAQEQNQDNESEENSVDKLPLSVMNNYFSMGADADVCLEFHESREANPERFKSRLKNLYFYGKKGSESLIKRKNKDFSKCIDTVTCDGLDLTQTIKELRPLCLIFLNISSYSAGTCPWGNPNSDISNRMEFLPQTCDDGYLEIIALTSKSMVATQVGGHGIRIIQCKSTILTTNTKISMQVDGEPCRLNPSRIHIKRRNQANMIAKKKPHHSMYKSDASPLLATPKTFCTKLYYLTFPQYDCLVKYDIDEIKSVVQELCTLQVDTECQLDEMRKKIETIKLIGDIVSTKLAEEWCFLDATWTARIYRIDESQESFLHVGDILEGGIYVLDLMKKAETSRLSITNSLSRSQPNTPKIAPKQRPLSLLDEPLTRSCQQTLHSLSLSCFSEQTSAEKQSSTEEESDLTDDVTDEDDMNSLSSSPSLASPNMLSELNSPEDEFQSPKDQNDQVQVFLDAAQKGHFERFKTLHESGASLTATNSSGCTPLHVAAKFGRKEIVEYIIEKVPVCVINLTDSENQTPLHLAALHKKRTICRRLVTKGASVTRQDTEGNTPQILALKAKDNELAKYLENQERLQLIANDDHETAV